MPETVAAIPGVLGGGPMVGHDAVHADSPARVANRPAGKTPVAKAQTTKRPAAATQSHHKGTKATVGKAEGDVEPSLKGSATLDGSSLKKL